MLITWGTKRVEKRLGFVADYCLVCADVRAFVLMGVGLVRHINHIPLGRGSAWVHAIRCLSCGARCGGDANDYAAVEKRRASNLEDLVRATNPEWRSRHAERLALVERVRRTPASLSDKERAALILEPFERLNEMVANRLMSSATFDRESGLGILATVFVAGTVLAVAFRLTDKPRDWALFGGFVLAIVGLVYTLVQLHFAPGRWVRRRVVPLLARALAGVAPIPDEIVESLRWCRATNLQIGKAVKAADVWSALQAAGSAPPTR